MTANKSVPGGCVIGLFGLGAIVLGALALFAAWRIQENQVHLEKLPLLFWGGIGGVVIGSILIFVGFKLALQVSGHYDPNDPNEPRMKF